MSDIRAVTFMSLAFLAILGGSLAMITYFTESTGVNTPSNFEALQNISGEDSETGQYLSDVEGTKRDEQEGKESFYEKIPGIGDAVLFVQDRFEDSMLAKAFRTTKVILGADRAITDVNDNEGVGSVLQIPTWLKWIMGLFLGLIFLFPAIYFFRGLQ